MFYDVTLKFSGSLHVTSNIFFKELVAMQRTLQKMANGGGGGGGGDKVIVVYACRMKEKLAMSIIYCMLLFVLDPGIR